MVVRGGWLQDAVFPFQINDNVLIILVIKVLNETHAQDLVPFGCHMVLTLWYVLEPDRLLLREVKEVTQLLLLYYLDLMIKVQLFLCCSGRAQVLGRVLGGGNLPPR